MLAPEVRNDRSVWETRVFQATIDSLPGLVAVLDDGGRIVAVNEAWVRSAAESGAGEAGVGVNYLEVCARAGSDATARRVHRGLKAILAGYESELDLEYPCHTPEVERWFSLRAARLRGAPGSHVIVLHADVTARVLAERERSFSAQLLEQIEAAVVATDLDGLVTAWNGPAERMFGFTSADALGRPAWSLAMPHAGPLVEEIERGLDRADRWEGDFETRRRDGSPFIAHGTVTWIRDDSGDIGGRVIVLTDATDRVKAETEVRRANRRLRAVTDSIAEGVFTLDECGRVMYINAAACELLGWSASDLTESRMHDLTHFRHPDGAVHAFEDCPITRSRIENTVVRVDDDIFIRRDGTFLPVAYTASPFETDGGESGSVVVFRDISAAKEQQLKAATEMEQLRWAGRVRDALENDGLSLYSQPIICARTGDVLSNELLLRLTDGDEIVLPGAFLPAADKYGLMRMIDQWVVEQAIEIAAHHELPVELNLSAYSIADRELARAIDQRLSRGDVSPELLTFEVTETAVVADETAARRFLSRLRDHGCKVALDDFGSGYGGFHYLKHFPIDYLKIDREFIHDIHSNPSSRCVVEAIVSLARGFGHETIAEGVETQDVLDLLRELGVDYVQGYLIGRPEPVTESRII